MAKSQNALRGRWENFWASEQVCVVHLVDVADVMDKLVYVATNPVKDRPVDKVHHWPGVNGLAALLGGHSLHATRPRHFVRPGGPMPAAVTLNFVLPRELGDSSQLLAALRDRVAAVEAAVAAERMRTGAASWAGETILRPSWCGCPASREPRRNLRPKIAARNQWARIEALRRNREFLAAYREARACWLPGDVNEPLSAAWPLTCPSPS